jgi:16S rRNA (guanine(966)-N(2))-methyltransferase RsmD
MRIIGGTMRGTKLFTLEGLNTRPTLDRVKESLFNILNFDLKDSIVLDLFSGSGALSLESVSRGAKIAYACDKSKEAIKIIEKNVEKTRSESKIKVLNIDYNDALNKFKNDNQKFDIIYLDPPYESLFAEDAIEKIEKYNLLSEGGKIIIETDDSKKVLDNLDSKLESLELIDTRKYGRVSLLFFSSR